MAAGPGEKLVLALVADGLRFMEGGVTGRQLAVRVTALLFKGALAAGAGELENHGRISSWEIC
jgi:hypothetical protein